MTASFISARIGCSVLQRMTRGPSFHPQRPPRVMGGSGRVQNELRALKYAILAGVAAAPLLFGQAIAQPTASDEDIVIVTGTRVADRTALDTAVAVDVVGAEELQKGGVSEVNQALSVALPSFNFPRPALNDGTDTVRPAALRGLAPDQTLVLVNSKRRHAASLVNVNGSIGRGSSAVDMNTIPSNAISSVEVRRVGAVWLGRNRRRHQRASARSCRWRRRVGVLWLA